MLTLFIYFVFSKQIQFMTLFNVPTPTTDYDVAFNSLTENFVFISMAHGKRHKWVNYRAKKHQKELKTFELHRKT